MISNTDRHIYSTIDICVSTPIFQNYFHNSLKSSNHYSLYLFTHFLWIIHLNAGRHLGRLKGTRFRNSDYTRADQTSMPPFICTASGESDRRLLEIVATHVPLRLLDEILPVSLISVVYIVIVFFSLFSIFYGHMSLCKRKGFWNSKSH